MRALKIALLALFASVGLHAQVSTVSATADSVCGSASLTLHSPYLVALHINQQGQICVAGTFSATISTIQTVDTLYHIRDTVTVKGNFTSSGGTHDTIFQAPGLVQAQKTASAIANNTYTYLRVDTLGNIVVDSLTHGNVFTPAGDTLTIRPVQRSGDSLVVKGNFSSSAGTHDTIFAAPGLVQSQKAPQAVAVGGYTYLRVDSLGDLVIDTIHHIVDTVSVSANIKNFTGCTSASPCYNKIDSVPLTTGGSLDTIRIVKVVDTMYFLKGGVLTLKANPANTNNTYSPISADTAGRMRVRLDSVLGCLVTNFPATCPIHVVGDSSHAGYPPGDSVQRVDTMMVMNKLIAIDSMQRLDSLIQIDSAYLRATDTCVQSYGGKSARDSVTFPAVSGKYIYVTMITAQLTDTLAITGTTHDTVSTTNLRGLGWRCGNAQAVGTNNNCVNLPLGFPIRSTASNTATLITGTAAGTGGYWTLNACGYYHAFRWYKPVWRVEPPSKRDLLQVAPSADLAILTFGFKDAA